MKTLPPTPATGNPLFQDLEARIAALSDPKNPTAPEIENLWTVAVRTYHAALLAGHKASEAKKEVAAWLWPRVQGLCKSESAIYFQLRRKIMVMAERRSLVDQRREAGKKKRAPDWSKEDRAALIQCAVFECGCILDFAWQECLRKKRFSAAVLSRYHIPTNHRPRCPKTVCRWAGPLIRALREHHFRPHYNSNNIAPMQRDWSDVFAQDIFESDDKTLDVLCRAIAEDGRESEIRCQFLPMIDAKSAKILDFVLIGEANYNSASIRTLIKRVCMKYGLPKKFQFERGIWKSARLLGNNAASKSFAEVENFATRCGVEIRHALPGRARTKIVETVLRLLDRKMYGLPGYIGNDEMHKKYERAKEQPLYTFDELSAVLVKLVEDYNETKQDSARFGYKTPNEVWAENRRHLASGEAEPVAKLTPEFEYLLSAHCEIKRLQIDGVKFQLCNSLYHYHSDDLVALSDMVRQSVKVWFDPEFPETAIVTDMKEEKYFPVVRVPQAPANAESKADWRQVAAAGKPYRTAGRIIRQAYSDLRPTYVAPWRPIVADAIAVQKSQRMGEARKQAVKLNQRVKAESFEQGQRRYKSDSEAKAWEMFDLEIQLFQRDPSMNNYKEPTPPTFPRPSHTLEGFTESPRPSRGESANIVQDFMNAQ